ncbi:hypothetical protein E3N88_09788 [Mikania micrantha]|uniref:Uncharacterized protein n=1 Tax=Mikania micrantha TaxID=192012 RepID=A0A5N6PKR7_9ASTR|nr:hypothetical protein E3N88_09788 [Mikania micrantha]
MLTGGHNECNFDVNAGSAMTRGGKRKQSSFVSIGSISGLPPAILPPTGTLALVALSFDLDEIERDCESAQKKGGIEAALLKRYRDRKTMAKHHFMKNGGYDDEERVRANPP